MTYEYNDKALSTLSKIVSRYLNLKYKKWVLPGHGLDDIRQIVLLEMSSKKIHPKMFKQVVDKRLIDVLRTETGYRTRGSEEYVRKVKNAKNPVNMGPEISYFQRLLVSPAYSGYCKAKYTEEAIKNLQASPKVKQMLLLYVFKGMTLTQIGRMYGIQSSCVHTTFRNLAKSSGVELYFDIPTLKRQ
jgi:hypothetical protein